MSRASNNIPRNRPMPDAIIIAIIGFISAITGYVLALGKNKADAAKSKADAGLIMGKAWRELFDELDERVKSQGAELCDLRLSLANKDTEIKALQQELDQLRTALAEKNGLVSGYEARIADLESEVETLRQQLNALGQKPRTRGKV